MLGDGMGDVVLGYPRPGLDAGEAGRGEDCRYRHATRAPAAQGEWRWRWGREREREGEGDRDQRVTVR